MFFQIALVSITIMFLFPQRLLRHWPLWGNFFDAIGLAAFAIQGALFAVKLNLPLSAAIVAAVLTGAGGGIVRDLLASRKPTVLRDEVYAAWAILIGLIIGLKLVTDDIGLYVLFVVMTALRIISYIRRWRLPFKKLRNP